MTWLGMTGLEATRPSMAGQNMSENILAWAGTKYWPGMFSTGSPRPNMARGRELDSGRPLKVATHLPPLGIFQVI